MEKYVRTAAGWLASERGVRWTRIGVFALMAATTQLLVRCWVSR